MLYKRGIYFPSKKIDSIPETNAAVPRFTAFKEKYCCYPVERVFRQDPLSVRVITGEIKTKENAVGNDVVGIQ